MELANANRLVFVLNGQRTEVDLSQIHPETTLLSYLRYHTQYKGAKLGCGEGGCGACVVHLSKYNTDTKETEEFSISSCLTLLGSIDGCSITTTEGLGNCRDGHHAIHKRIAGFHASQCGYCTPGWCMSLYGALRQADAKGNNDHRHGFSNISSLEAEKAVAGNVCRCTGYRPIADVCKSFAGDVDLEDLGLNTFWKKDELLDPNKLPEYNPTGVSTDSKFCGPRYEDARTTSLNFSYKDEFSGEERVWIRPSTLDEVLGALEKAAEENVEPKLVVGNTSAGIYKSIEPKVFVDIRNISELQIIKRHDSGIEVGAAVTIAKLIKALEDTNAIADDTLDHGKENCTRSLVFEGLANHLKKVASAFIRNTASIGGNIIMAKKLSFDSDVATILLGANASVKIISTERVESVLTMEEFLDKPCLDSRVLLLSVFIPNWNEVSNPVGNNGSAKFDEKLLFKTYRTAIRPLGNAVSYVNAAFLAQISLSRHQGNLVAKSLRLAFGAFGVSHAIRATSVEEFLVNKVISPGVLLEAIEMLKLQIIPVEGTPKSAYRQSVAVGFLFDFISPLVKDIVPPCIPDSLEANNNQSGNTFNHKKCSFKTKSIIDGKQTMEFHDEYTPVGQPSKKVAAELQASGEAVFVDDIPSPDNCLYGAFVYSKKALALIKKVDVKDALESPSVVSYISYSDIPKQGKNISVDGWYGEEILFAEDTVECFGQPIGLMVANTWHDAKRAADKVSVDYDCETLGPPILSVEDAGAKNSFYSVPQIVAPKPVGDLAKGMSEADIRIESAEVRTGSQYYFYLETQTVLAIPDEDECMVVYSACQNPDVSQKTIAKCLGIPTHNVRVITRRVGGGFGGKAFRSIPAAVSCALAAYKLKRPVRMYLDRKTDMIMSGGRHPIKANYTVGLKNDGKITALHVDLFIDAGFTVDFSPMLPYTIVKTMMKYNWGAFSVDYKVCKTNLPSKSAMRGPGETQGSFFAETIIEHVASILGLDSVVVREKNIHTLESAKLFYGSSVESPVSYTLPSIWEKLKQSASFYERMENIREFNATNRWFKRGLSLVPCFYVVRLSSRPARVTIFEDGSIAVEVGGVELGQGIWTKVKQMTAYALGQLWPGLSADIMAKVRLFQSDSISLAHGGITAGSTTSEESCEAVRHACDILVQKLQPVQTLLKKSNPNGFSWNSLIFQAKSQSVDLSAQTYWVPDSSASQYLNYGAGASEVEIDLLSGATTILQTDIIYDCGRSLNPAVDLGQIEGAFVQGVGFFMTEEHHVDNNGKLVSDGTWTYKVPTIDTIPRKFNVEILNSPFHQKRILSSKASGEPPLLLAASVHCAIREAIRAARKELPTDNNKHFRMDTPASMDVIKSLCGLNNVELYLKSLCISTKQ
ncbi:hypothetical protein SUGI_0660680 [Cryptomeria japonica]|uniref:indole-3-acetaldehyde oxidase isoform X1 n=1 Tax=Cryptomeria japonica TaxID=3369 RepID=UPI0024149AEE|nr:indole-3-acetaldehyde oxidase isoform X1 [Cryptomeria japonica]GLJ32809.1 hypothetical protein SUGI_0660680 [Cryptomeria japonica]